MSSTRFNNDISRIVKRNQEQTDIGRWVLNTPGHGVQPHYYEDPHIRLQHWGANLRENVHPIDIASDLDGRMRQASKWCPSHLYPNKTLNKTEPKSYPIMEAYTHDTRTTHPSFLYRDLQQHRKIPLHFNPQDHVHSLLSFENRINTRNEARDLFNVQHN